MTRLKVNKRESVTPLHPNIMSIFLKSDFLRHRVSATVEMGSYIKESVLQVLYDLIKALAIHNCLEIEVETGTGTGTGRRKKILGLVLGFFETRLGQVWR